MCDYDHIGVLIMSIKKTAKVGSVLLLFIFVMSSALSSFFVYKMKLNFDQVEVLATRFTDIQDARYQLATMLSNVNYLLQSREEKNATDSDIIEQNKSLAIKSESVIEKWVNEKKMTEDAQKSTEEISKLFYSLIDRLIIPPEGIDSINVENKTLNVDFNKLNTLFDNYFSIVATNKKIISNK